jgi:hypothetical protein
VVEQLGRLFRRRILDKVEANIDLALLNEIDRNHPFDRYIEALESIREAMHQPSDDFYIGLLQTEIKGRYSRFVGQCLRLQAEERRRVLEALSAAHPVLEGRIR